MVDNQLPRLSSLLADASLLLLHSSPPFSPQAYQSDLSQFSFPLHHNRRLSRFRCIRSALSTPLLYDHTTRHLFGIANLDIYPGKLFKKALSSGSQAITFLFPDWILISGCEYQQPVGKTNLSNPPQFPIYPDQTKIPSICISTFYIFFVFFSLTPRLCSTNQIHPPRSLSWIVYKRLEPCQ